MRSSFVRLFQTVLIGVGLVMLAYAGGTVAYAELFQRYLSRSFAHRRAAPESTLPAAVSAETVDLSEGNLIGKLEIPQIGISVMVLQGVEEDTLRAGVGHVPGTPLPGADGNSAIAGHRDTFFRKLKRIRAGERIQFSTVHGLSEYVVDSTEIVEPEDTQVMESRGYPELTLITCYPFYFVGPAPHRFIVHAHPIKKGGSAQRNSDISAANAAVSAGFYVEAATARSTAEKHCLVRNICRRLEYG